MTFRHLLAFTRLSCAVLLLVAGWGAHSVAWAEEAQPASLAVQWISPKGHINNDYVGKLLRLALDRSGVGYSLEEVTVDAEQGREINMVKRSAGTVMTAGTSAELEALLHPIRIPIYRGLLGYRIGIINRHRQPKFSAIKTLAEFRRFSIGQGIGWSDTHILESAGFNVITADYQMLFRMVARNRFDCFLRGVNEAFDEVALYGKELPDIAVEKDLVLYYPFAMFFFVNKDDTTLALALGRGLARAHDDGSFLHFFKTHPQTKSVLKSARLHERRMFRIDNPTLTPESRSIPEKYWLMPE